MTAQAENAHTGFKTSSPRLLAVGNQGFASLAPLLRLSRITDRKARPDVVRRRYDAEQYYKLSVHDRERPGPAGNCLR
jgi:hypothetical protein